MPVNPHKGNHGLIRVWHALKNSLSGLYTAAREESAFRQELALAVAFLAISALVPVTPIAHVLLAASVLLVLIVELLNSGIEAAIDRISLEYHDLSKRAKDYASAAVMLSLILCAMTWLLILVPLFGPRVLVWLHISAH